ncbi:hypothetical protein LDO26_05850 [Luteimonas sp. BDR2-5]|uniref:hypothetical protein n=1 Tax=Proluteimonas luteida TaxID=2878685 RepID=UPI001E456961|nr:hypothetical protein [Luteimonas sp. BDR2-5]MCD9027728.1 hypothetical protein [Luteimonas sp. BDR2-5]
MTDDIDELRRKNSRLKSELRRRECEVDRIVAHNQRLMDEKKKQSRKLAALQLQYNAVLESIASRKGDVFRRLIGLGGLTRAERESEH